MESVLRKLDAVPFFYLFYTENLNCTDVRRLDITSHSHAAVLPDNNLYSLEGNNIQCYVYTLHSEADDDDDVLSVDEHHRPFRTIDLPHQCLDEKWESLVFEEPVKETTLRTLIRATSQNENPATAHLQDWQNTVIFHGPQGCVLMYMR